MRFQDSRVTRLSVAFATVMLVFAIATVLTLVRLAQFNEAALAVTGLSRFARASRIGPP